MKRNAEMALLTIAFMSIASFLHPAKTYAAGTEAIAAANNWISIVDAGDYAKSWETAAKYFRNAVSKGQWEQSLAAIRYPLGSVLRRQISMAKPANSLPGAPDGKYVIITYITSFTHKRNATETVTPMIDPDGKWRVAGYYIK